MIAKMVVATNTNCSDFGACPWPHLCDCRSTMDSQWPLMMGYSVLAMDYFMVYRPIILDYLAFQAFKRQDLKVGGLLSPDGSSILSGC